MAKWILLLYPILILACVLAVVPMFSGFRPTSVGEEVVTPTSFEPFQLSDAVLPPMRPPANEKTFAYETR